MDSSKKEITGSGGAIGRAYCDKLFKLERKWKELSPEERKRNRLIENIPVLDAFFAWAEKTFTNQEYLKKALNYTLNHKNTSPISCLTEEYHYPIIYLRLL